MGVCMLSRTCSGRLGGSRYGAETGLGTATEIARRGHPSRFGQPEATAAAPTKRGHAAAAAAEREGTAGRLHRTKGPSTESACAATVSSTTTETERPAHPTGTSEHRSSLGCLSAGWLRGADTCREASQCTMSILR